MRVVTSVLSLLVVLLIPAGTLRAAAPDGQGLVVLETSTIAEFRAARALVEAAGGHVTTLFPPSAIFGTMPPGIARTLSDQGLEANVYRRPGDAAALAGADPSAHDASAFWTRAVQLRDAPDRPEAPEPLADDLVLPRDLPGNESEKRAADSAYQRRWKVRRSELMAADRARLSAKGRISPAVAAALEAGARADAFGTASGAGYYDTSRYLAGDVAIGVFFTGSWKRQELNAAYAAFVADLDLLIGVEPNAPLTFTLVKEVDAKGNPLFPSTSDRDYVNNLRNAYGTDWALVVYIEKNLDNSYAEYWGPSAHLASSQVMNRPGVVRHEVLHVFGAQDQYPGAPYDAPNFRWGYLNVVNANSCGNNGWGYFGGAGECQPDIMVSTSTPDFRAYTRGQVGWRDSDGDGLPDPLDTIPDTAISSRTGGPAFTYAGAALDVPHFREGVLNPELNSGVTLNTVVRVEFRIDGGGWAPAQAEDGAFDSGVEGFIFTTPRLADGAHLVEVRAVNSVGNEEISFARDEVIAGGGETNTSPTAAFAVAPAVGSVATVFTLDAATSSDAEDHADYLEVRWDFEGDGGWDTSFSPEKVATHRYAAGTWTARTEVRDSLGATSTAERKIEVKPANVPPTALFTVAPENQHGGLGAFSVSFDASASYDGEDAPEEIQVRWDFEDDGVWDTPFVSGKAAAHDYPLPSSIKLSDSATSTAFSGLQVWVDNGYAYVASGRLETFDLDDPLAPVAAGFLDTPGYTRDVFVAGNHAYLADETGLAVVDVSIPSAPTLASYLPLPGLTLGVHVAGSLAYLGSGDLGLHIVDVSDPAAPRLLGTANTRGYATGVWVDGRYAYLACQTGGLQIVDVTDPASPRLIGGYNTPGSAYGVQVVGQLAYVADLDHGVQILDISDPSRPARFGSYPTRGNTYDLWVAGGTAYVADATYGLDIVDVTDPARATLVVNYQTGSGNWTSGVHVPGNYAYAVMSGNRLIALDVTPPLKPTVEAVTEVWRARLEVRDTAGATSQAVRDVWAVTYNHPPVLTGVTRTETGFLAAATDPDAGMRWDAYLFYRWDFDSDGNWDTAFATAAAVAAPAWYTGTPVTCEAEDSFAARSRVTVTFP